MNSLEILAWITVALIALPVLAYLMAKFGVAGFLRALDRRNKSTKTKNNE